MVVWSSIATQWAIIQRCAWIVGERLVSSAGDPLCQWRAVCYARSCHRTGASRWAAIVCYASRKVDGDKAQRLVNGTRAGGWIKRRLGGEFGAVTLQVPKGFAAYARIFHPAAGPECKPVRWADVAKARGKVAHREMQWHAIVGSADAERAPPLGAMDLDELETLCEILAAHTPEPDDCFFGLCEIWSWVDDVLLTTERKRGRLSRQHRLKLPLERNYVVIQGAVTASQIGCDLHQYAPNLIWSADHSWLVASEVDFDSTLVGGSAELIEAIVNSPKLEAWQVEPTDSLAIDADKINATEES